MVIDDGISGFIIDGADENARIDNAIAAIGRLGELDNARVRAQFDKRWTSRRMAEDYVGLYSELIGQRKAA